MSRESESEDAASARASLLGTNRPRKAARRPREASFQMRVEEQARRWRPAVFIGSSTKSLRVAQAVKRALVGQREAKIWKERGVFEPSAQILTTLVDRSQRSDFAILIGGADDLLTKKGSQTYVLRDNVVFEFGLFAGALGLERSFLLVPRVRDLELPSDLAGMVHIGYQTERTEGAAREVQLTVSRFEGKLRRRLISSARRLIRSREFAATRRMERVVESVVAGIIRIFAELDGKDISIATFTALRKRCLREIDVLERRHLEDIAYLGVGREVRAMVSAARDALLASPDPAKSRDPLLRALLAPANKRATELRKVERVAFAGSGAVPGWTEGALRAAQSIEIFVRAHIAWLLRHQVRLMSAAARLMFGIMRAMDRKAAEHPQHEDLSLGLSLWRQDHALEGRGRFDFTAALRPRVRETLSGR